MPPLEALTGRDGGTRRWLLPTPPDPAAVDALCRQLNLRPITAAILVSRGFDTPQAARDFLRVSLNHLHPPETLPDIDPASERIRQAILQRQKSRAFTFFFPVPAGSRCFHQACVSDSLKRAARFKFCRFSLGASS